MCNPMATVQTLNGLTRNERQNNFRQSRLAILRKSKCEATPHTSQRKVASHLLLPQRTINDFYLTLNHTFIIYE